MPHVPRAARSPVLVSASRRTDIPRFYADWFRARRAAGFAEFENVFGVRGRVSLLAGDVLGYLFWTRDPSPFRAELRDLRVAGIPYAFQFTLTDYGVDLEANRPSIEHALQQFLEISQDLPLPNAIEWRYDPIVLCSRYPASFHVEAFGRIAERLQGATRVVNTSLVEPYLNAVRRLADPSVLFRTAAAGRHAVTSKRHPDLAFAEEQGRTLAAELSALARHHGMQLRSCANPELGLPSSQCCSTELFLPYGPYVAHELANHGRAPSRGRCRCLRSVDIGMNETCRGGCRYCYVVRSDATAARNHAEHDPLSPSLRTLGAPRVAARNPSSRQAQLGLSLEPRTASTRRAP